VVLRDGRTVAEIPHEKISQDAVMVAMAQGTEEEVSGAFHPDENSIQSTPVDSSGEVSNG
jgi:ABC-type sugar transport system ATPase subunit